MSVRTRKLLLWVATGLVGLVLAAGVSYAATQLSSQRIGLSAEPPSAGEELAPPGARHVRTDDPTRPRTTPTSTVPPPSGSSSSSGGQGERRRKRGGDLDD